MTLPSSRIINGLGIVGAVSSMLFALLFLQGHLGLEPCPLCVVDRAIIITLGCLFLAAALHNPQKVGRRIYAAITSVVALTGVAVCWRHIWLQNLPEDLVPSCGPGLDYMLDTLPIAETVEILFTATGECADIQWNLMGLTIPEQTLIVFNGFLFLALVQLFRKTP
ncbi:disulfide bond formation protein B [Gammaproteobacteria bacterium 45_16_T64]|nr:disulfide bond formation protein B [Gammaproteobacteria bacterium 45_16_T64]